MKLFRCIQMIIALALVAGYAGVCDAQTWWNEQWKYRKKITFDTGPAGADIGENLTEVPVLIRLHAGNFNFTHAKQDGSDIRFVATDGKSVLKSHVERFDPIDGMGLIWVKVPRIVRNSNQEAIWMYYGNPAAAASQDAAGTYDVSHALVYHLGETEGPPRDSTGYGNHASQMVGGQGLPTFIGNGAALNGAGDRIVIPAAPSLKFTAGLTFTAWLRVPAALNDGYLFFLGDDKQSFVITLDRARACSRLIGIEGEKEAILGEACAEVPLNAWHHLAVTVQPKGKMLVYLDGEEAASAEFPGALPEHKGDFVIGASSKGERFFGGDLDEIRIYTLAKSRDWIKAAFKAEGQDGRLYSVSQEEMGRAGGLPVFYLKTIVKNISLDGWVIIGLLVIFSAFSWLIFFSKTITLILVGRENRLFLEAFSGIKSVYDLAKSNAFTFSPLYRVYLSGCEELKARVGNPGKQPECALVGEREMNALRSSLDRAYVRENQRLNAWLVVLTMAITGGPFLGLLGTVWGVMNTFAAMAEAGEANIMAIAPGVASALSTTVFGLIVAIPALFKYNYLTSKIRSMTMEIAVFIDQFSFKVEEVLGNR